MQATTLTKEELSKLLKQMAKAVDNGETCEGTLEYSNLRCGLADGEFSVYAAYQKSLKVSDDHVLVGKEVLPQQNHGVVLDSIKKATDRHPAVTKAIRAIKATVKELSVKQRHGNKVVKPAMLEWKPGNGVRPVWHDFASHLTALHILYSILRGKKKCHFQSVRTLKRYFGTTESMVRGNLSLTQMRRMAAFEDEVQWLERDFPVAVNLVAGRIVDLRSRHFSD